MKFSLQVLLLLLPACLTHASVPEQINPCPYKHQVPRACGSAGIRESTCPGVGRPWCDHYNYESFRKRPCGCMDGTCRHRNKSCVLCSECGAQMGNHHLMGAVYTHEKRVLIQNAATGSGHVSPTSGHGPHYGGFVCMIENK
uniref:Putative secreted protein n=1 Tax=Rhipicephalus microplus TaxID=6941 RepID=A0A6G5A3I0_RHIMP